MCEMAPYDLEPIAIVGSACRFPGSANSPSTLWKLLEKPRDLSQHIPKDRFDTMGFYHGDGSHHGTTNVRHAYLLEEDIRVFDAAFFNISPNEADSIDPQQRLLLEAVYEALERGGHTLEALRGSDTAVFTGTMSVDYADTGVRDFDTLPTYFATGINRAIISNRVSYVFDWHGPSMTIDTACSSSLIAVHQGVKALRTGESRVAVACGTQVILNPETFIIESKLNMLSPTGHSRMWDADADGYARGEGVAAVVLKKLSDAIADGDRIESIIRETGSNQDGHTSGITVPSTELQAALIAQTYARAGLDPNKPNDRPQFFEAHGTGTKAGDPREAAAIHQAFGRHIAGSGTTPLYVGSVKTVIGHLEGAAGLAGLLKASESIQQGLIPPNLLFNRLNPAIEPFYQGLQVPTKLTPWPQLPHGVPRRVSVNSFGFGGSNAHAILEQYVGMPDGAHELEGTRPFTPFVFSAANEASLVGLLAAYSEHLKSHPEINLADLAWTLQSRRTQFSVRAAFSAQTSEDLTAKIDAKLNLLKDKPGTTVGVKASSKPAGSSPRILGIFTGQGAQWATMGAQLVYSSKFVRERLEHLQEALATLPPAERPSWHIRDEMLAAADTSRISEAALSQPLCTAIQIVLVDLLRAAGLVFSAVVGHSSGEIAAAYTAGFLSARDAIRVAYYRGLYANLAGNNATGQKGAMLAVGTSWEDAQDLVSLRAFRGRLSIAAHNSPASVTLSGDADAVVHAKKVFDEEKKFARLLKVDTAYHSQHMLPCGDPYVAALKGCDIQVNKGSTSCEWYSSVVPGSEPMGDVPELAHEYWRDNMTKAVLFSEAVKNAVAADDQLKLAIEVGPHPALKGPATQNITEVRPVPLPYSGVLSRGMDDVQAFSEALGYVWTQLGAQGVDLQGYNRFANPVTRQPRLVVGLPSYQWNHDRVHWSESRRSRKLRERPSPPHELLGTLQPESNAHDMRWSNVLKTSELSWLDGHQLQGQTVFPAAGYVAMALEGSKALAGDKDVVLFELNDLLIPKAIVFEDGDNSGVETLVTLTKIHQQEGQEDNQTVVADFSVYSVPVSSSGSRQEPDVMASGSVKIVFGTPRVDALSCPPMDDHNMYDVDPSRFYDSLEKLGYGYRGGFQTLSAAKRRLGRSVGTIDGYDYQDADDYVYLVHPTTLDVAFQASILAYSGPSDDHLWSLHVPTAIRSIRINPQVCAMQPTVGSKVPVSSILSDPSASFSASIDLFSGDGQYGMIQVEDLIIKPFAPATKADDRVMFTHTEFDLAAPDGDAITRGQKPSERQIALGVICERLCYYYVRKWKAELSDEDWTNSQPHFSHLRNWVNHTLSTVSAGKHIFVRKECSGDKRGDIDALIRDYLDEPDIKMITAVGENMVAAVKGETTILEHMVKDDLLDKHYKYCLGAEAANGHLAAMAKQITHRYPHARILEIGAGTGGATKAVLEAISDRISSYTYTDISVAFFANAERLFSTYREKMTFKTLDVEKLPSSQGFEPHSYDIIIASNVLHATPSLEKTLQNTRQLLKPGGYLLLLELTNPVVLRSSMIFGGLPGWWLGVDDGRKLAPIASPSTWHSALRKAGFAGVDAITPEVNAVAWPASILASQALDDRVQFLRRPLAASPASSQLLPGPIIESLVIAGTGTLETSRIAEELSETLGHFCGEVQLLDSLPTDAETQGLVPMTTFVILADLDNPIFKGITENKMEGLKRVFDLAKRVLWITRGALADEPYHMASVAFSRVMRAEAPHVSLNVLDMADEQSYTSASKHIAEHLLRQVALDEWETNQGADKLLWSKEQETFLTNGKLVLPRLVKNVDQNARLNSARRAIFKQVALSGTNVALTPPSANSHASLVEIGPLRRDGTDSCPDRVEVSSLMALRVSDSAFLFLGLSRGNGTGARKLLFSLQNSSESVPVASVAAPAGVGVSGLLVAVASELLAGALAASLPSGSTLLVHCSEKDRPLATALSRNGSVTLKRVRITFVCDADGTGKDGHDPSWIRMSAREPQYVLRKLVQQMRPLHFLDLTTAFSAGKRSRLGARLKAVLSADCVTIEPGTLLRAQSSLPSPYDRDALLAILEKATAVASSAIISKHGEDRGQDSVWAIPLEQVAKTSPAELCATSTVRWPLEDGQVTVNVRQLDATRLFHKEKSYLLLGMSGKLGQSLCEWMVASGAGCVVLTSRNPQVDERWMKSFEGTGATVKVLPMNVTDMQSVESTVAHIRATCAPVAGVCHGAMVLHDSLFSGMSAAKMQEIISPKVDGANNLEAAFRDDDLDFFVMYSSVSMVIGNAGQSLYAAGNGYLNGLARQRRRRGLAGSTFDIGRVTGIGYVESAAQVVRDQLIGLGLPAISESDMRHLLAETIQAGFPQPDDKTSIPRAVVSTGIRYFHEGEDVKGPWFTNSLFSHCVVEEEKVEEDGGDQSKKTSLSVSQQISKATNKDQVLDILIDCFSQKLRVILQLGDQAIDADAPLVDLGIDSLVAVEVRGWFLKELKVDIPVLKVVGGASPVDLCQQALKKLPEEAFANLGGVEIADPTSVPRSAAKPNGSPQSPDTASSSVTSKTPVSSSDSQGSTPTSSTTGSTTPEQPTSDSETVSTPPDLTESPKLVDLSSGAATGPETTLSQSAAAPPRRFTKSAPISLGQSRFWFLQHMLEEQRTHNVAYYYHVTGNLRVRDLERAVRVVANRHESLRTCFLADESDEAQASQKVLPRSAVRLECKNIVTVGEVADEYTKLRREELDMGSGELLRLVLLTLSPSSHYLLMYHHHIIMDGVSLQVFLSDLEKAYIGQALGPSPRQYPDFSVAQRQAYEKGEMVNELEYWRGVFPSGQEPPVLPLLPMARVSSRVRMSRFDTHQVEFRLGAELAARVKAVSKANRSTPFNFYLAAFKTMLLSFTDAEDIVIGIADAARNESDIMGSIGFFLNLLPLRFRRRSGQQFADAVIEARDISHAALANSRLPFDVLLSELGVARDSSYSPFFQAFIDYRQGAQAKHAFGDCQFEIEKIDTGKTAYDITLDVTDGVSETLIMMRAQKSLYDATAAQLLSETFVHFVEALTRDAPPALGEMPIFSEAQRTQGLQVGRGPKLESDWPATLPHRIDQVSTEHADKVALVDGFNNTLTYAEMSGRIEAIAEALQDAQVGMGSRVLVFQQAASDWPCSMLAIMRVGAIYVPLDLRNPLPRLAGVAADCDPAAVLVDNTTVGDAAQLHLEHAVVIDVSTVGPKATHSVENMAKAESPAAILYTSGSTGTPKGIVVRHSGLRNEIEGYTKTWGLKAERVLQQSAFTFNHSSDQMYTGLVNGGTVYIVPWSKRGDAVEIAAMVQQHGITYTKATPSEYLLWMQFGGDKLRGATEWRFAFGGGENLSTAVTQEFADLGLPQLRVFNSYGPTEISISSTKTEVAYRNREALEALGRIPCGFSLPNYNTYVVDEQLRPLPVGMPGELCISGAGVSLGIHNNKDLTDQVFVPNPFPSSEDTANGWTTLYRTGDIGHLEADGAMVFHNRIAGDSQVKIRGIRIELSDIESNIVSAAGGALLEAAVTLRESDPDFLVAHVVFAPSYADLDEPERETFLARLLSNLPVPQYMIPVVAIPLEKLPLTNHSKIDRKAVQKLPLPSRVQIQRGEGRDGEASELEFTEAMAQLRVIWRDVLGGHFQSLGLEVKPSTSFFAVGGNSLLVLRLQQQIRRILQVAVPLVELLGANTLAQMASLIEARPVLESIDWEEETVPPLPTPAFLKAVLDLDRSQDSNSVASSGPKTVVITGGTGYLAKFLLPRLVAHPAVGAIHCVAVRDKPGRSFLDSPKIAYHRGDLAQPRLGLSEADFVDLAARADVVVHMGGARSFWDAYHVLRAANVLPTRELIRFAAPRRVPIHYLSTAAVLGRDDNEEGTAVAGTAPPTDDEAGTNGYVATRWASERILARAANTLSVPAIVHRFAAAPAQTQAHTAEEVLRRFVELVDKTGAVPDEEGWGGRLDMIPAEMVANWLCQIIIDGSGAGTVGGSGGTGSKEDDATEVAADVRVFRHDGRLSVTVDELVTYIQAERGSSLQQLERLPIVKWLGRIKAHGFEYFLTSHDAVVGVGKDGKGLQSWR